MAKMRVHELAKELEIKSQEIIDSLSGTEYEIKSASNNIDDAAQEIIRKKYKKSLDFLRAVCYNTRERQKRTAESRAFSVSYITRFGLTGMVPTG